MTTIRVNKQKNFVVMSNRHFKEKDMSLKAKGLLSQMLSLPDNWDYSIKGLASINKESEKSIKMTLDELKKFKYLVVRKQMPNETKSGRIEYIYDIYEEPFEEKQPPQKQPLVFQPLEKGILDDNHIIYNKILNNKILNNNKEKNIKKESYGTYGRVKLTTDEYSRLVNEFGEDFIKEQIELLDEYIESNNNKNKYTNFNLVLRRAIRDNWFVKKEKKETFNEMLERKMKEDD